MHKRKLLIGLATAGLLLAGFRRRDDAGLGRAAHPARHPRRRRAGHGDGRRAARHADRPDPDPRRQRADRQRPGHHARAARAGARADASRPSRCRSTPTAARATAPGARDELAVVLRPRGSGSQAASPNTSKPTAEPHAGQQAQQVTTGKLAARLKLRLMLPRRPRTPRRRRPRTRPTRRYRRRRAASARRPADARQPHALRGAPRSRADRRAELLHRQVPDPAVPAADLPGRRHRVRRALGDPGRDQRDRDRLRAQPQRLDRRRRGLDAVHALDVEALRRGRQPRRPQGSRSTRSTRSSPPRAT